MRSIMRWGLLMLLFLTAEALTGALLTLGRLGLPPPWDAVAVEATHIYTGLGSLPILAAKLWLSLPVLSRRYPLRTLAPTRRFERLNSYMLVALVAIVYSSGLLIYWKITPGPDGKWLMGQVHLWSSIMLVFPVTWHLYRYLILSLRGVGLLATRVSQPGAGSWTRRAVLGLLPAAFAAFWYGFYTTRRLPAAAAAQTQSAPSPQPASVRQTPTEVTVEPGGKPQNDFFVVGLGDLVDNGPVNVKTWRLAVNGAVKKPLELSYRDVQALATARRSIFIACLPTYAQGASREWQGVLLADVLKKAQADPNFASIELRSIAGYHTTLSADEARNDRALLAILVDGVPLSNEHGFPMRFIHDAPTGSSCVKWLAEINVSLTPY